MTTDRIVIKNNDNNNRALLDNVSTIENLQ